MTHTTECPRFAEMPGEWKRCTCHEPDTDWAPELPCGGISTNGAAPPLCEVHMKPWGHRARRDTPDLRATARNPDDLEARL